MKILHLGPEGGNDHFFSLLRGFSNLGHEVKTCNIIRCDDAPAQVESVLEAFQPDFVITIGGWHAHFDAPAVWSILKKHSVPHVYWAIEDPVFFDWVSEIHAKSYDFVLTVSEESIPRYSALGVRSAFLPYACNPDLHRRVAVDEKFKNDIVVMANKVKEYDPQRCWFRNKSFRDVVEPILLGNYDSKIYGAGWAAQEPPIPPEKIGGYIGVQNILKAYSSSKIALAIQWDYTGHICFRIYEALACGILVISPYTPVQEKAFQHEHHIIYSHDPEETKKYVEYYLAHDSERERIARQGQEEAYKNHNCTLRAETALRILKENKIIPG